jgi:alkanesulfonate monooxygenase SsuD/methylene tetrahydromethanopterin reductase-like flavin-dependent oxidoreductase (luciferase family)
VSGWDGAFTYDAIAIGATPMWDPWVVLAAMALRTERITLGAIVFAPTRRRPWKLYREALTLDHLSGGRMVLPVGLGALDDLGFGAVGEVTGIRERAAILDETLAIIDGFSSGEPFGFAGETYRFDPIALQPTPLQRPRIPIWPVGVWPSRLSFGRALRWDGIVLQTDDPVEIARIADAVRAERPAGSGAHPFEIVAQGSTPADDATARAIVGPVADAGATWWIEGDWSDTASVESVRARIGAGPPRPW